MAAPAFAIRKPAVAVFTLDDYATAGIMTPAQAVVLRQADDYATAGIMTPAQAVVLRQGVAERRNILVAGGTSTGKTTLTNALLAEIAKTADRVALIEGRQRAQPNRGGN